ncbi:esterase [Kineobactrum sediminis]|uniref:Esterase n=1 Tax=Kineobactrum sediminis TaxID=1905677 RepID=A0A2N5Y5F1_9GAMM|nr:alpha/beta hydrolase [Kineobactrum sediminis]PLW83623.1 esterase [Kineobactrum sediminis]
MKYNIDPELTPILELLPPFDLKDPGVMRATMDAMIAPANAELDTSGVTITDHHIPGAPGDPEVPVRVYQPENATAAVPGLIYLHGGGFVFGNLESEHANCLALCRNLGIVVVSVDYRLSPETAFPGPLEDCYAALSWAHAQRDTLDIDERRLGIMGQSAGGCLAAATALATRERGGPALCYQFLSIPVLDDRLDSTSMRAFTDTPIWHRPNAEQSWDYYLGSAYQRGGADVPALAAPAREQNLAGLPAACVTVMEFDPLRDEALSYAQRLLAAGVSTEIHCYPGTFHGSSMVTEATLSRRAVTDTYAALTRGLCIDQK